MIPGKQVKGRKREREKEKVKKRKREEEEKRKRESVLNRKAERVQYGDY